MTLRFGVSAGAAQAGRVCRVLACGLAVWPGLACAAPDAGSILQQLEARPGAALVAPRLQTPQVPTPPAGPVAGPVVRVNAFRVQGTQLLESAQLQEALKGFTGRELSLTQLQEAAWVVVQTYRAAGWLVHAFVPPQEIEGGVVTLQVIEARLGQVRLDANGVDLSGLRVEARAAALLPTGQPINLREVDRLLLLLDDLPGLTASASFVAGQEPGSTDVLLVLGRDKPLVSNLSLDNHGSISTGRERLGAHLAVNNPGGWGDALQLQLLGTEGSQYARLAYSLPVGLYGWRAGVHASDMRYHLLGSFAALKAQGSAQAWGFDLSAPIVRQPERNLSWQLSTDRKQFDNQALATQSASAPSTVSHYQLDVLRSGLSGNWLDSASATQNTFSVQASWGRVDLGQSPNEAADASAARTAGAFQKLNASYNREQRLNAQALWYLQASAQWADRNLDSSERLYLGGASGVRAYPSGEAGGSTGSTLTTGIRHRLSAQWSLDAFADWGRIHVYQRNLNAAGAALTNLNAQSLRGLGLSLQWRDAQGRELSATWSRRQGGNPAANPSTGADSDGTRTLNRLWLSAALSF